MNSKLTLAAVICSGICIIPYDLVFLNYQDDTRIEWDVLEAIPKYIDVYKRQELRRTKSKKTLLRHFIIIKSISIRKAGSF